MTRKSYLVTGGTGFLGSALVARLVRQGARVRLLDNNYRGDVERLKGVTGDYEYVQGDVRDAATVQKACHGMDCVCHLAFINGTRFFYTKPALVLEVGILGMMNVLQGCIRESVPELILASSSEVYQTPPEVPTDEKVPLSVPDPLNPRYSYGGAKIVSELLAINYGRKNFRRVVIFRPHNVYGPDMGWDHVVPEFVLRMRDLRDQAGPTGPIRFPIQGAGKETRSFVYIDDLIDGVELLLERGEHMGIYNIGSTEEITIETVAVEIGRYFGREVEIVPGPVLLGSTRRRCPNINKLARLGYSPKVAFRRGLPPVAQWYDENAHRRPTSDPIS